MKEPQKDLGEEIIEKLKELEIQLDKLKETLKNDGNERSIAFSN